MPLQRKCPAMVQPRHCGIKEGGAESESKQRKKSLRHFGVGLEPCKPAQCKEYTTQESSRGDNQHVQYRGGPRRIRMAAKRASKLHSSDDAARSDRGRTDDEYSRVP